MIIGYLDLRVRVQDLGPYCFGSAFSFGGFAGFGRASVIFLKVSQGFGCF